MTDSVPALRRGALPASPVDAQRVAGQTVAGQRATSPLLQPGSAMGCLLARARSLSQRPPLARPTEILVQNQADLSSPLTAMDFKEIGRRTRSPRRTRSSPPGSFCDPQAQTHRRESKTGSHGNWCGEWIDGGISGCEIRRSDGTVGERCRDHPWEEEQLVRKTETCGIDSC
jgi:hypothetical protein